MKRIRTYITAFAFFCSLAGSQTADAAVDTAQWVARLDSVERLINSDYEQEYRAIQLAKRSAQLKCAYYGENSEQYLLALLRLSELYSQRGINGATNRYHRLAYEPYMEKLRNDFCQLSENQKTLYWQTASAYFDKTMTVAYNQSCHPRINDGSQMAASAYDALLLSKGLLLNLSIDIERFVQTSGNQQALQLWEQRKRILNTADVSEVDSIDMQILAALREAGQPYHIERLSLRWQQVQAHLQPNDLAIEFFRTQKGQYGALLLKSDWETPKIIPLTKKKGKREYTDPMVWTNRLLQYFPPPGQGTVYFSADGFMYQQGVEYLPFVNYTNPETQEQDVAVMSDVYNIVRLSSTRELAYNDSLSKHTSATVYGGIGYNMGVEELVTQSRKYDSLAMRRTRTTPLERGKKVQWLPGTLVEATTISQILNNNNIATQMYSHSSANEESFKALNRQTNHILHIATHGFMWAGDGDPMTRCGLLMAGANVALSGEKQLPEGVQDGILTAKEIALLDLNSCNLAVLSACETAKGDVTGEGVFGLQRAFKMAGVQTIIMSLWPVNDDATRILMTEFYTNWIEKHLPKHEAFREAQNAVRYARDEDGDLMYNNPIYWAGFILMD